MPVVEDVNHHDDHLEHVQVDHIGVPAVSVSLVCVSAHVSGTEQNNGASRAQMPFPLPSGSDAYSQWS